MLWLGEVVDNELFAEPVTLAPAPVPPQDAVGQCSSVFTLPLEICYIIICAANLYRYLSF